MREQLKRMIIHKLSAIRNLEHGQSPVTTKQERLPVAGGTPKMVRPTATPHELAVLAKGKKTN